MIKVNSKEFFRDFTIKEEITSSLKDQIFKLIKNTTKKIISEEIEPYYTFEDKPKRDPITFVSYMIANEITNISDIYRRGLVTNILSQDVMCIPDVFKKGLILTGDIYEKF